MADLQQDEVRFDLSGAEVDRFMVVGGDLEWLAALPTDRLLTKTEIRLAAAILRRLLVDGHLGAAWRPIREQTRVTPTVTAVDLDSAVDQLPPHWLQFAWAGGASAEGAHHAGFMIARAPSGEVGDPNEITMPGFPRAEMLLDDWLKSTAVAVRPDPQGAVMKISRRTVLKYFANRRGGVHFDPRRNIPTKVPSKRREETEFALLDHGMLRIGHLSGPEYEIASMVQDVTATSWAKTIIAAAKANAPDDFEGDPAELHFWDGQEWATSRYGPNPDADLATAAPPADSGR